MKLKKLESYLQSVETFENAKAHLEQYQTQPEIASRMIHTACSNFNDIEGQSVLDLGCGTGILSIASALCGAQYILSIDVDSEAIELARHNCEEILEEPSIDFLLSDVKQFSDRSLKHETVNLFDVAIMNPPFGTKKNDHVDMKFLEVAAKVFNCSTVYSLHKSCTRDHLMLAGKALGFSKVKVLSEIAFDLPPVMRGHTKKNVIIAVDFIRFSKD